MTTASEALRAAAEFGDFFRVVERRGPGWTSLADLGTDEDALRDAVEATRARLAGQRGLAPERLETRATASVWFLGLAARLVSPPFGAAVAMAAVPRLDSAGTFVDGTGTVATDAGSVVEGDTATLAGALDTLLAEVVGPLAAAVARTYSVSRLVLWGNVASALAGAAVVVGVVREDLAGPARSLAELVGSGSSLAGTGEYRPAGFVRSSCCLYYRLPGSGLCGDCVLSAGA